MKDWKNWFLVIVCIVSFGLVSCRTALDGLTPALVPKPAAQYLEIGEKDFWTTLAKAKQIEADIFITHRTAQINLLRLVEDDENAYKDAIEYLRPKIKESEYVQGVVVGSENQPFSLLGILAGFTGGAAIGRVLKRKGDFSPDEHEAEVQKAKESVRKELDVSKA